MKYKIVVDKRALNDLKDSVEYYNNQTKGLGKKFIKAVDASLVSLEKILFIKYGMMM